MRGRLPRQVPELTLDLGLDVERLLAPGDAARVACLDQRADLLEDLRVAGGGRPRELRELVLDVHGRLAPRRPAGVARLEHLADLRVALRAADRRRLGGARPQVAVLADGEPAAADV